MDHDKNPRRLTEMAAGAQVAVDSQSSAADRKVRNINGSVLASD
jgi:hypothetical protein|eukprot:COSAG01_NODE_331_length_18718_cov_21.881358_13_plen_44_part_00